MVATRINKIYVKKSLYNGTHNFSTRTLFFTMIVRMCSCVERGLMTGRLEKSIFAGTALEARL